MFRQRVQTVGTISEFMEGKHKVKNKKSIKPLLKGSAIVAGAASIPLVVNNFNPSQVFAQTAAVTVATQQAIPVNAAGYLGGKTLGILAHALDPLVQLLTAISFPIASIIMIGGCFYFMFGNTEKAWGTIQNAGLGYLIIQLMPMFLNILKQVGAAL